MDFGDPVFQHRSYQDWLAEVVELSYFLRLVRAKLVFPEYMYICIFVCSTVQGILGKAHFLCIIISLIRNVAGRKQGTG